MEEFYSNGKLLITGEYLVLDGAKALGVPTQKGQSLTVTANDSKIIEWSSFDCHGKIWYQTKAATADFFNSKPPKGDSKFDDTLFKILWHSQQLNPDFLDPKKGYSIQTHLTFERLWGLGTSSTLINNIANWAKINPFELLNLSFGGSGYDIACAGNHTAIFYKKTTDSNNPSVTATNFNPPFKDRIFFIYLNEKKDSKEAITNYRALDKSNLKTTINIINALTDSICNCTDFKEFESLITKHEEILSAVLKTTTVKQDRFLDYKGAIKSLGGWGGDFVLATGTHEQMSYFKEKGYYTIIPFSNMVLT